jgi:molybdopterin adenylyltransferase
MSDEAAKIGLVSISDRASKGVYQDEGLPALRSGWGGPWSIRSNSRSA